jgi:hypothetical protein
VNNRRFDEEENRDLPGEVAKLSDNETDESLHGPDIQHFHDPAGDDPYEGLWRCHCDENFDSHEELTEHLKKTASPS